MKKYPLYEHLNIGNIRPRRIRLNANMRSLVSETVLLKSDLIVPLFISEAGTTPFSIPSLPGVERIPLQNLATEIDELSKLGARAVLLFPVISTEKKDRLGTESCNSSGLIQEAVRVVKKQNPQLVVMTDVALDPFTLNGHDGITDDSGEVLNDATVDALCRMSLSLAEAGVDFVAPSDMMDGRVGAIRAALDAQGFSHTGILAYSAKYASAFYGPFREAIGSGARGLDKRTYQLEPENARQGLWEAELDAQEGADIIMVKPALCYLDIIAKIRAESVLPIAAYHVSGEYAMLKAAVQNNWLDEEKAVRETLISIKRAGADMIVTYYAKWALLKICL